MTLRATITPMRRAARVTAKPLPKEVAVEIQYDDGFPFCCGISVLGEAKVREGGVETDFEPAHKDALAAELLANCGGGLQLYTTIQDQAVEKAALASAGFRVVATFCNPSTSNMCQLHAKLINQPARRTRAAARRRGVRRASRR